MRFYFIHPNSDRCRFTFVAKSERKAFFLNWRHLAALFLYISSGLPSMHCFNYYLQQARNFAMTASMQSILYATKRQSERHKPKSIKNQCLIAQYVLIKNNPEQIVRFLNPKIYITSWFYSYVHVLMGQKIFMTIFMFVNVLIGRVDKCK